MESAASDEAGLESSSIDPAEQEEGGNAVFFFYFPDVGDTHCVVCWMRTMTTMTDDRVCCSVEGFTKEKRCTAKGVKGEKVETTKQNGQES